MPGDGKLAYRFPLCLSALGFQLFPRRHPSLTDGLMTPYTRRRNMRLALWNIAIVASAARIGRWLRASGGLG